MTITLKSLARASAVAVALAGPSAAAIAAPLVGDVAFNQVPGSTVTPVDSGGNATAMGSATGINFSDPNNLQVTYVSGNLPLTVGQIGSQFDFQFANVPVNPLWTVGTLTFVAETISIDEQDFNSIVLSGTGYVVDSSGTFEQTRGTWDFSMQQTGSAFSFSSSSAVPLPGTLALFGLGALVLGGIARSRRVA